MARDLSWCLPPFFFSATVYEVEAPVLCCLLHHLECYRWGHYSVSSLHDIFYPLTKGPISTTFPLDALRKPRRSPLPPVATTPPPVLHNHHTIHLRPPFSPAPSHTSRPTASQRNAFFAALSPSATSPQAPISFPAAPLTLFSTISQPNASLSKLASDFRPYPPKMRAESQ